MAEMHEVADGWRVIGKVGGELALIQPGASRVSFVVRSCLAGGTFHNHDARRVWIHKVIRTGDALGARCNPSNFQEREYDRPNYN